MSKDDERIERIVEEISFEDLQALVKICPSTWLPALLTSVIEAALSRDVFPVGSASRLARSVEADFAKQTKTTKRCWSCLVKQHGSTENAIFALDAENLKRENCVDHCLICIAERD